MHVVVNREAQLVNFLLTAGNIANNNHQLLNYLLKDIQGKVYGDKGYVSTLKEALLHRGVDLVAKMRRNGKKDALVQQKDAYYHRHRSPINYLSNAFADLYVLRSTSTHYSFRG